MKSYLIKSIISVCVSVAAVWGGYYLWNYKNRTLIINYVKLNNKNQIGVYNKKCLSGFSVNI